MLVCLSVCLSAVTRCLKPHAYIRNNKLQVKKSKFLSESFCMQHIFKNVNYSTISHQTGKNCFGHVTYYSYLL